MKDACWELLCVATGDGRLGRCCVREREGKGTPRGQRGSPGSCREASVGDRRPLRERGVRLEVRGQWTNELGPPGLYKGLWLFL